MTKIRLFIPCIPKPKARPKFKRTGHAYTPKKTKDYERYIAEYYVSKCDVLFKRAVAVRLTFYMPIAKSYPKKVKEGMSYGYVRHTKRPDLDNLIKAVTDALLQIAYLDDAQIIEIHADKRYRDITGIDFEIEDREYGG